MPKRGGKLSHDVGSKNICLKCFVAGFQLPTGKSQYVLSPVFYFFLKLLFNWKLLQPFICRFMQQRVNIIILAQSVFY